MSVLRRIANLLRRSKLDREIEAELRSHVEMRAADNVAAGMSPERAADAARRALGNALKVEEDVRATWGFRWLETLGRDVRYGVRQLRRSPGFTIVAILTLALGIGANTGMFSVVNGVLLNPLPYPRPNQLVTVAGLHSDGTEGSISYPDFLDWVRDNRTLSSLAGYKPSGSFNWARKSDAQPVSAVEVSASFFSILGIRPALGRNFTRGEDELNGPSVVILSGGLWKSQFGSAHDVIGKTMNLDGTDYTIIGVLSGNSYFCCGDIYFPTGDVYVPLGADKSPLMQDRKIHPGILAVGRVKDDVTLAQARADMTREARNLAAAYPEADKDKGIAVTPVKQEMAKDIQRPLLVLLAAVGFVLLIACANVANLLLARSTGRAREFAIRAALGASGSRVIRQMLTETVLLALCGGALGVLFAAWGTSASLSILPSTLPRAQDVRIDAPVLLFTLMASLVVGILFGLAPALKTAQPDLHEALKEGGRGTSGARYRTQGVFVVVEVALAVVLLIGAGLTIRTLLRLWSVNPGFDPHNVLTLDVDFPASLANGSAARIRATLRQVTDKIAAVPGVRAASLLAGAFPMNGQSDLPFWVEGQPKPAIQNNMPDAVWYIAGPDYVKVMRIPLLRGRFLGPEDQANSSHVCVIDENLARKYFGNRDPIGKRLNFELVLEGQFEIVGVVGHVNELGLDETGPGAKYSEFYTSALQLPDSVMTAFTTSAGYVVRTEGSPNAFIGTIRAAVRGFNSKAMVFNTDTMDHFVSQSLASRRFAMILLAVFAGLALVLASIGIYGVISYVARQRRHEIGIRMALGAQRGDILKIMLGQAARLAIAGVIIGLVAAAGLTRLMSNILFGVSSTDPLTFATVAVVLFFVALAACYVPARRAMKVDPMVALRYE